MASLLQALRPCTHRAAPAAPSSAAQQQAHPPARLCFGAPGSSGSSSGGGSPGGHLQRLPPVQARRAVDPVVAPVIALGGPDGEEYTDLYGYLLRNRIVFVGQRITDQVATQVVATLLALNSLDDGEDIKLYINCAAGSPYAVFSILDTIKAISAPVSTVAFGMVGGAAATLLAAGAKGKRFAMPSARIMLQQPNGGAMGSADEVNIQATELNRTMKVMYKFLSEYTSLPMEQVEEECDRENFLSPQKAVELGLIDGLIGA